MARDKYRQPTIIMSPVPIAREGNPWYPLPPDYPELDAEGQRLARVNACCQRSTPNDFVAAWSFFRQTYLEPTPPGFFYKRLRKSPPGHLQMVRDMAEYGRNIHVAPRGSAKSTVVATEVPLLLALTRPYFVSLILQAIHPMVELRFSLFQKQFTQNENILKDFGQMKPKRADGQKWSLTTLMLNNGAMLYGTSVDSAKRGGRPDAIFLDDPEYDPEHPGQETNLREKLEPLLFHQLLPMLDTNEQIFEWCGTLINCKSALYSAVHGQDPRFALFNRRVYAAAHHDSVTGQDVFFWPDKWDSAALESKKQEIGDAAYQAEYLNNPVSAKGRAFVLHPDFNSYMIVGEEVTYIRAPDGQRVTLRLSDWLATLGRVMTVDLLHKISSTSDYVGGLVVGLDNDNCWWVLDLYLGRVEAQALMAELWKLGVQWQPSILGIESAAGQQYFQEWMEQQANERQALSPMSWTPRAVWPVRYPAKVSKEDRINALIPRVSRYRLRMPSHLAGTWPMSELYRQLTNYTTDGLSLDHDDAIDMLAMIPYCPKVRPTGLIELPAADDVYTQLSRGEVNDSRTGLPITSGFDISRITDEVLRKFLDARDLVTHNRQPKDRVSALLRPSRDRGVRRVVLPSAVRKEME